MKRKDKYTGIEIKKLASGKLTFKLSHIHAAVLYHIMSVNKPQMPPRYAHAVLHYCAWACIVEVMNKTMWVNHIVKFTLTPAQASAMCYMLIPHDSLILIELKAKLLKSL